MTTSNEPICTQHGCALVCILHVHNVHVAQYIHREYQIQLTALHMRIGIVILLWAEALRLSALPRCAPSRFFIFRSKLAHL
jgi:hypothetical protein